MKPVAEVVYMRDPTQTRCTHCIHPPHQGICEKRSGGTAWRCGCHHSPILVPRVDPKETP